jgi:hypothetical protein
MIELPMTELTEAQSAALFGFIGGICAEALGLYNLRKMSAAEYPQYLKSFWRYWVPTILMCMVGAVLAVCYTLDGTHLGKILTMNIGISAPLLIGTFTKQVPQISE